MNSPNDHCLLLMAGLPGAGKSTLAREVGKWLDWPVIDKDVILSAILDDVPNDLAQPASYAVMLALGREFVVNQRRSVILDSPAVWESTVSAVREICREAGADLKTVLCLADRDVRNERVQSRKAQRSQPAGSSTTAGTGIERFRHVPEDTLIVRTERPLETIVTEVLQYLTRCHE